VPVLRVAADPGRSQAQVARLFAIGRDNGLDADEVRELVDQVMGGAGNDPRSLSRDQYDDLCDAIIPGIVSDGQRWWNPKAPVHRPKLTESMLSSDRTFCAAAKALMERGYFWSVDEGFIAVHKGGEVVRRLADVAEFLAFRKAVAA